MKLRKKYVIPIVVVLVCLIGVSVYAAITCPNCASDNVTYLGVNETLIGDDLTCPIDPATCTYDRWKIIKNYGCDDCLYNWGSTSYENIHTDPSHN